MDLEVLFPDLILDGYRITSPQTQAYNCIAWAANVSDDWWWPDPCGLHFWPDGILRLETVEAFVAAFESLGYWRCPTSELENNYDKVALYCLNGMPQHAAKQLQSGRWT